MTDILKRIDHAMEACRRLDVDMWSIDTIKWAERVNPDLIHDIYQYIESMQLKLMHQQTEQAQAPRMEDAKSLINYAPVYEYAKANRLSYNELSAVIQSAIKA